MAAASFGCFKLVCTQHFSNAFESSDLAVAGIASPMADCTRRWGPSEASWSHIPPVLRT